MFLGLSGYPTNPLQLQNIIDTMAATGLNTYRMSFNPEWFSDKPHPYNANFIQYLLDNSDYLVIVDRNHLYPPSESTSADARSHWSTVRDSLFEVLAAFPNHPRVAVELINEYVSTDYNTRMQALITEIRDAGYTNMIVVNKWTTAWHKFTDPLENTYQGYHFYFNSWSVSSAMNQMNIALSRGIKVINTEIGADWREHDAFTTETVNELNSFLRQCANLGVGNMVWMNENLDNWPRYQQLGLTFPTASTPTTQLIEFADSFEVSEWNGLWEEDRQNDWFRSTQRARDGSYSAEIDGWATDATLTMANSIDLTDKLRATLSFSWYIERGWDTGEYICLDLYYNGVWHNGVPGTYHSLDGNQDAENTWHDVRIELNSEQMTHDFKIRFRATVSKSNEDGQVDDVTITSETADHHTLTLTTVGQGKVTQHPAEGPYPNGTLVELTALADPGWTFATWSGDVTGSTNPEVLTMDEDKMVTATFTPDEYTVTVTTIGSGTIITSPDQTTYHYGDVLTLTAVAEPGWRFIEWTGDVIGSANPASITIMGDTAVTATFTDDYVLTITSVGGGAVTQDPDQAYYTDGTVITLTAEADPGWTFTGWSGDVTDSGNPASLTMDGDKTVTATFTPEKYTLTVHTVGSGSINADPHHPTYHYGDLVTLTAMSDPGWSFAGWSGDYSGTDNPRVVTIYGDTSVTATFIDTSALTVNIEGSGSVDVDPDQLVYPAGTVVELMAVAEPGWSFVGWSGDLSGSVNPVSLALDTDTTVTATFTESISLYLFTDGYESGSFAEWTGTTTVSGSAAVTSNMVYTGEYSGHFSVNAGSSAGRAYSHITVDGVTDIYARAYVYLPDSLALSNGQKLFLIQFRDAGGSPLACFGVMADASGMRWAVQSGNWPYALGSSGPSGEGWYLVEAYFTQAASGPTVALRVDGVEVASLSENTSGANAVASVWVGITYCTGNAAVTVHVDDVALE
jgi:uncharacterized repeat protein (TIGR02543 family)